MHISVMFTTAEPLVPHRIASLGRGVDLAAILCSLLSWYLVGQVPASHHGLAHRVPPGGRDRGQLGTPCGQRVGAWGAAPSKGAENTGWRGERLSCEKKKTFHQPLTRVFLQPVLDL